MGSENKMKQIGLYGGAFNPIHNQHLINAQNALEQRNLDEIWFVPTKHHAFKGEVDTIDSVDRIKMIELAIGNEPKFKLDKTEIESAETNYTYNTINTLEKSYANVRFHLIIGGDNISNFHLWKHATSILDKVCIICCARKDDQNKFHESLQNHQKEINFVSAPESDLSSSYLRNALKEEKSIRYYVPAEVAEFIKTHQLYSKDINGFK